VQTGGVALTHSAIDAREQARRVAADLLEAKVDDVVYDCENTRFHVRGTPARFIELAVAAQQGTNGCIEAALRYEPTGNTISFGAYLAVVEVDTETGKVDLRRFVAVDDCGTVINHTIVEGQVHGGVAQGIGQALFEEIVYDREGNLLTTNFADYTIPSAADLPAIEALLVETPTPRNVLGAKGVGESGPIGALPAVLNAIVDALTPFGVDFVEMPATPERVWRAIQSARA
jgi:aerobic carbon-monoxide dehydrogenase large subunit